ncbi:MAG: mechanosensitive ion channel domain-containing protein [bacterium]
MTTHRLIFGIVLVAVSLTAVPALAQNLQTTPVSSDTLGTPFEPNTPYIEYLNQPSTGDGTWSFTFSKVLLAVVIFFAGFVVLRFATRILETVAERRTSWRLAIKAMIPVIRISSWTIILYIIVAHIFAPPIQTLVALTASAGIAIGFASQDILKNIFGGIMILFDRPFQVGDKVEIGEHYGEVVNIGLRTVRILTPENSIVSVPNAEVVNQSVVNANMGERGCQVAIEFHLPPTVNFYRVRTITHLAAATSRYVLLSKPIGTSVKNVVHESRSMVYLKLNAFVFDHRYEFAFRTEVTERVLEELLKRKLVTPMELALTSGDKSAVG